LVKETIENAKKDIPNENVSKTENKSSIKNSEVISETSKVKKDIKIN